MGVCYSSKIRKNKQQQKYYSNHNIEKCINYNNGGTTTKTDITNNKNEQENNEIKFNNNNNNFYHVNNNHYKNNEIKNYDSLKKTIDDSSLRNKELDENNKSSIHLINQIKNFDINIKKDNEKHKIKRYETFSDDDQTNRIILNELNYSENKNFIFNNLFDFSDNNNNSNENFINSLFYLTEFHITNKFLYTTEDDFNNLIKSKFIQNKEIFVNQILNLNERQWNNENILISNFLSSNRYKFSTEKKIFKEYLTKLSNLNMHFNLIVKSLSYYYYNSLLKNQNYLFTTKYFNLPSFDSIEWVKGFEWKGLFVKVQSFEKSKKLIKEINAYSFAFLDYLKIIENFDINNIKNHEKILLSNEIIFPLIGYEIFAGLVLSVSVCINKYKFFNVLDKKNYEKFFDFNDLNSMKNNTFDNNYSNINYEISGDFDDESFRSNLINEKFNFNDYNLIDLKYSKIFENLNKNNLIKIIFDDNNNLENNNEKNTFKFMLINIYDILPNIINENEIVNNNKNINIIFDSKYFVYKKDFKENIKIIYNFLNIKNTNELEIYENNLYNFYYKFLYLKNEDISIDNNLTENYIKIPLNQNEKLYHKISTNYLINNNMNKILYDLIYKHNKSITKKNIMIYDIKNILKQKYFLLENRNYKKTIEEYYENFINFCQNLNNIKSQIDVDLLENELKKFGINKSFLIFCLPFLENEIIKNLIIIYIFVKIIRKLIFYNFGIDFYMRIGIFDRSKKSNDLYQNESNKKNNIIEIQKERIFYIIKGILENKNTYLIEIFNKYLSFFIYIQFLKWIKIDNDFKIDFFVKYEEYKKENLLNLFKTTSINNPSLFINIFQKILNIKIKINFKYNSKNNLNVLNNFKKDDIIINQPKIFYNKENVIYSNYIINSIKNYENIFLDKNKRLETKNSFKNIFSENEQPTAINENKNHSNNKSFNNQSEPEKSYISITDDIYINE